MITSYNDSNRVKKKLDRKNQYTVSQFSIKEYPEDVIALKYS